MPITLPTNISVNRLANAAGPGDTPWRKAVLLLAAGSKTAQEIADEVGMARSTLFQKMKRLKELGGSDLHAAFQRKHGGGRAPKVTAPVLEELKSRLRAGQHAKEILAWLEKEHGITMSAAGIYYYKRVHGFQRSKQPTDVKVKTPPKPRPDPLLCHLDEETSLELRRALDRRNNAADLYRTWRVLVALRALEERTNIIAAVGDGISAAQKRAVSGSRLSKKIKCSPKLLYKVAALFNEANSIWDRFIKLAFTRNGQAAVSAVKSIPGFLDAQSKRRNKRSS